MVFQGSNAEDGCVAFRLLYNLAAAAGFEAQIGLEAGGINLGDLMSGSSDYFLFVIERGS